MKVRTLTPLHMLLLVAAIVALTPLAYASPPDPVWVAGFFDNADYDDVVVFVTSSGGVVDSFPLDGAGNVLVPIASLTPADEAVGFSEALPSDAARAPPVS